MHAGQPMVRLGISAKEDGGEVVLAALLEVEVEHVLKKMEITK